MVNTYIAVPTAVDYSLSLGAAATVCGVVIGLMAVAQVFSSVYFSAWSNKSYIKPLIFSSIVLLLGNTLYALAYDLNSYMSFWLDACSMTRAVNRRYISDCVPQKLRMKASAGFVTHVTCWEIANFSALCHINGLRRVLLRCSKARGMDLDDACDVIEDSGIGLLLCSLVRGDPSHKSLAFLASAAAFSNIGFRLGPPSPFGDVSCLGY
ncbi:hypothetical protein L1987_24201 [Smallanthus sonchifolius]|uniref:Uncharacterized protein n=1 Tax=Smallanthus sonchifolius TaxID=185202 RepID=A0ACB9IJJ7_9ASTR|nr:hypothetical protein L1987_24201 [Smallanthus sonchifolius]